MKEDFFVSTILKTIAAAFLIVIVSILFQTCRLTNSWQRSFISEISYEKQKWLDADLISDDNPRPGIARELVNNNVLIGKTREEIFEMLGGGETVSDSKSAVYLLEEIYRLDIDPVASEDLIITFDEANKAEKAEIRFYTSSYF